MGYQADDHYLLSWTTQFRHLASWTWTCLSTCFEGIYHRCLSTLLSHLSRKTVERINCSLVSSGPPKLSISRVEAAVLRNLHDHTGITLPRTSLLNQNVSTAMCGPPSGGGGVHPFDAHDLSAISRSPSSFILVARKCCVSSGVSSKSTALDPQDLPLPDLATCGTASEGTSTRTSGQYLVLTKKQRMGQSPSPCGP